MLFVFIICFLKKMMSMMNKLFSMTVYQVQQVLRNGPCDNISKEEPNHFCPFSSVHMIFIFLSDPGVPGVRSMGPVVTEYVRDVFAT